MGWRMAPTSSSRSIQLHHWVPDPILPPRPSLKMGSIAPRAPPPEASTRPVRSMATRIPASEAGAVAASQAWQTSARNPLPGGGGRPGWGGPPGRDGPATLPPGLRRGGEEGEPDQPPAPTTHALAPRHEHLPGCLLWLLLPVGSYGSAAGLAGLRRHVARGRPRVARGRRHRRRFWWRRRPLRVWS